MASAVQDRLTALALAHALTLPQPTGASEVAEQATTLHMLIRAVVAPYEERGSEGRIVISGPDISIAPAVLNFSHWPYMNLRPMRLNTGRFRHLTGGSR
jgi:hypothetical protein